MGRYINQCFITKYYMVVEAADSYTTRGRPGISPIIGEVVIAAVVIVVAIAAAFYFSNIAFLYTRPYVTVSKVYTLYPRIVTGREYIVDKPTLRCCYTGGRYLVEEFYPLSYVTVTAMIGPLDDNPSTHYCLYLNVTALKQLRYIRVHASVLARNGAPPSWVGDATVDWQDNNVPSFWYASRYWCPIRSDEFPLKLEITVQVPGPGG